MKSLFGLSVSSMLVVVLAAGCGGSDEPSATNPPSTTPVDNSVAPTVASNPESVPASDKLGVVVTYEIASRDHIDPPFVYDVHPPVGGDHFSGWQNCGVYREPVEDGQAVHSLEHGAVWLTYDPELAADEVATLEAYAEGHTHILVSPYPTNPAPVVATAWGAQIKLASASDPKIAEFISEWEQNPDGPEPGVPCSGALGEPVG